MKVGALFAAVLLSGCQFVGGLDSSYTLYRDSPLDAAMRVHIASFDTSEGEPYNRENCMLAADLFQRQEGVITRFWCEKGRYRP